MKKTVLAVCIAMAVTGPNALAAETVPAEQNAISAETCGALKADEQPTELPAECLNEEMPSEQLASIVASAGLMAAAIAGATHI